MFHSSFHEHVKNCEKQSAETARKIDKLENRMEKLEDQLDTRIMAVMTAIQGVSDKFSAVTEKNHNENQKWIRGVAYTLIIVLLTIIGELIHGHIDQLMKL
jgi:hypothetical protein